MAIKLNEAAERDYFAAHVAPRCDGLDVEVVENADFHTKTQLMASAAAVLFPIRWPEPFGLVPLEANACGTPVVAFAEGAVPEVVADGASGFLIPPGDLDAFCASVNRVGELDPAACRAAARDRFDTSRMVAGYTEIYRRLASSRPADVPAPVVPIDRRRPARRSTFERVSCS